MSRRSPFVFVALALLLVVSTFPAYASSPNDRASASGDVEKAVFIHYPKSAPQAAAARASGGKGGSVNCPDPSTCTDYQWSRTKWFASPSYLLDAAGSGLDDSTASAAIQTSFDAWTSKTTSLSVSGSLGSTSCATAGSSANSVNQICWRDLTADYPNAIAVTFVWYYRFNKQIIEADAVFNNGSGFAWSYTDPSSACGGYLDCNSLSGPTTSYDLRNIATHEFGHFLAFLGDLYAAQDSQMTMYGYGSPGEMKKDSLAKGDCLGITKAYGGSC